MIPKTKIFKINSPLPIEKTPLIKLKLQVREKEYVKKYLIMEVGYTN